MSEHIRQSCGDLLFENAPHKAAPARALRAGRRPGAVVVVACLLVDLILMVLAPTARRFIQSTFAAPIVVGAVYGIMAAQLAMAAIWLGVFATALYWMLAGVVAFCVAVSTLLPTQLPWSWLLTWAFGGLTFTLPFALVNLAGYRLEERRDPAVRGFAAETFRFPLSQIFVWIFVVAALLGIARWLSATVAPVLAISVAVLPVAVTALATMWVVLGMGRLARWVYVAPLAALTLMAVVGEKWRGWNAADVVSYVSAGAFFIATLAGLLACFRAAGLRLMPGGRGGWLVR